MLRFGFFVAVTLIIGMRSAWAGPIPGATAVLGSRVSGLLCADPECETVYLMPSEQYTYLASSLVRELASLGADVSGFVPPGVEAALRRRFSERGTGGVA